MLEQDLGCNIVGTANNFRKSLPYKKQMIQSCQETKTLPTINEVENKQFHAHSVDRYGQSRTKNRVRLGKIG